MGVLLIIKSNKEKILRKRALLIWIILTLTLLNSNLIAVNATTTPQKGLNIYFVNNQKDQNGLYGFKNSHSNQDVMETIKNQKPFISLDDITEFNWDEQRIYLKKDAWKRLNSFINSEFRRSYSIVFVVEVNKKPLYYGYLISTKIANYPRQPWIWIESFNGAGNKGNGLSFPIYFNTFNKDLKDPRFSPVLLRNLKDHGKIVNHKKQVYQK